MSEKTVLIIDDEENILSVLERLIRSLGSVALTAGSCAEALETLSKGPVDLILLDIWLPDGDGVTFFRELRANRPDLPVIFMTGQGKLEMAIDAMRLGARDFLLKPFNFEALSRSIRAALTERVALGPNVPGIKKLIGESPAIREVWNQVDIFAPTDITILLLGESGTGKELFARAIHAKSKRCRGPFIELDCASIPTTLIESELFGHEKGAFTDAETARPGKFELANGGTLFLDELGNLSPEVQAKLLRVVQERRFRRLGGRELVTADVRLVGATNLDLEEAVRRGAFRRDLYFRLSELPLRLPLLRDREGDISRLANHFLHEYGQRYRKQVISFTPKALERLESFDWPGNVRELENVVRAAVLRADHEIDLCHLPPHLLSQTIHLRETSSVTSDGTCGSSLVVAEAKSSVDSPPMEPLSETSQKPSFDSITVSIPPLEGEAGINLKLITHQLKADLEKKILTHLIRVRRMNKAQMARYLQLDYKILLTKFKLYGLDADIDPSS